MDTQSFETLKRENFSEEQPKGIDYIIDGFEAYANDGTPFCAELWNEEQFEALVKLLGIEKVQGESILRYHLENTHSGRTCDSEERGEQQPFVGEWRLRSMLETIADMQGWEDRINDYRATLVLQFDESTVIAIGQDCIELSDEDQFRSEPEQEHRIKYWVGVLNAKDLNNYRSWKQWELKFFDEEKARAEKDAKELERERAHNITNLSRIKAGDEVTVTTKRLERSPYDTGWRARYSEEELAERFIETYKIIEAGGYGYIVYETAAGERIRIDGGATQTTRKQNPVQKHDRAHTPSFGYIYPNQHLMFRDEETLELSFSAVIVDSIEVKPATSL